MMGGGRSFSFLSPERFGGKNKLIPQKFRGHYGDKDEKNKELKY